MKLNLSKIEIFSLLFKEKRGFRFLGINEKSFLSLFYKEDKLFLEFFFFSFLERPIKFRLALKIMILMGGIPLYLYLISSGYSEYALEIIKYYLAGTIILFFFIN